MYTEFCLFRKKILDKNTLYYILLVVITHQILEIIFFIDILGIFFIVLWLYLQDTLLVFSVSTIFFYVSALHFFIQKIHYMFFEYVVYIITYALISVV